MEQDPLQSIFSRALSGRVLFKDRRVLLSDYIPDRLLFRDKQIAAIGEILAPLLHSSRCSNILLYGKTGTGKTAVARYVAKSLLKVATKHGIDLHFPYCNCRVAGTEYRILVELGDSLNVRIPFTGLALSEAWSRILEALKAGSLKVVFILDEIDFLVKNYGDDLLYEFTRVNERLSKGFFSLIGISNDLRFKEFLDPRVLSSLSEEEIVFPPYTAEELRAILSERAKLAFYPGVVREAAINLCAALAGSEHGDARRAVDLLRVAGEMAEREGSPHLEEHHIRAAAQSMEQDRVVDALRSLPLQAKLVLLSISTLNSAASTGEVYARYSSLCRKIGIEALTQRRVSALLSELDLLGLVSANVVSQGRYGRTKRISALVTSQLLRSVFQEDPVIGSLV
ncbi:MAG: orc1/cdc6 family replication initiation protein [Nitrososphaerota archaeon]